jgi:hypothetical protein
MRRAGPSSPPPAATQVIIDEARLGPAGGEQLVRVKSLDRRSDGQVPLADVARYLQAALKGAQDPSKGLTQLRAAASGGKLAEMGAAAARAQLAPAEGSDDPEQPAEHGGWGRQGHHAWRQRGSRA